MHRNIHTYTQHTHIHIHTYINTSHITICAKIHHENPITDIISSNEL